MDTKPMGTYSSDNKTTTPDVAAAFRLKEATTEAVNKVATTARTAYDDVLSFGQKLPQNVAAAGRAIDTHVHDHPRADLAIVGGASILLGAIFGRRFLRIALLAAGAFALTKAYPSFEPMLRRKLEQW